MTFLFAFTKQKTIVKIAKDVSSRYVHFSFFKPQRVYTGIIEPAILNVL